MKTFILLTFGFLTFAFYQMSGGADFEPASAQLDTETAQVEQIAEVVAPVAPPIQKMLPESTPAKPIDDAPDVTRVALNLTNISDAVTEEPQAVQRTLESQSIILDSSETPQIILPSLLATSTNPYADDIRTVSGNRVNVRGGPSTNYGIVSKLTRGEEVRILEDNGNGWVLMQPVEGGETGWMADFLLSSG
jgi:hypothetical protein